MRWIGLRQVRKRGRVGRRPAPSPRERAAVALGPPVAGGKEQTRRPGVVKERWPPGVTPGQGQKRHSPIPGKPGRISILSWPGCASAEPLVRQPPAPTEGTLPHLLENRIATVGIGAEEKAMEGNQGRRAGGGWKPWVYAGPFRVGARSACQAKPPRAPPDTQVVTRITAPPAELTEFCLIGIRAWSS